MTRPAFAAAFVCAMPMEQRPLVRPLRLRRERVGDLDAHVGTLDGRPVISTVTGMGPVLATAATDRLLAATDPERIVVVGITGAVEDETPIGTLVLPEVVVDGATGTEHRPEPLAGGVAQGRMWTTDRLTPPDELPALRAQGVVSLDMETAAVAAVAEAAGVPWSVFRAISDRASDGSVDDEVFGLSHQDGSPNGPAVVRYLVRHPQRIAHLARLGKGSRLATQRAARAAVAAVRRA